MRLGVVGMLPDDIRTYTGAQIAQIAQLGFSGVGCHLNGALAFEITDADCARFTELLAASGLELAQFSLTYSECLFSPDQAVRAQVSAKIVRGIALARQLQAQAMLLRPGSLNPAGPWTPHRDNHRPENLALLAETLRPIAQQAERDGVVLVMEAHTISILDTPEICRALVEQVGSANLRIVLDTVNHFQTIQEVYNCADRLNQIIDVLGPIAPIAHIKDLVVRNNLVVHIDEVAPGEGELDIGLLLRRFQALYPHGYGLIEHLPPEKIPAAAAHVRQVAAAQGVPIE